MQRSAVSAAALVLVAALLGGCASVVAPPETGAAAARHLPAGRPTPAAAAAGVQTGTPARAWWTALGDPVLDEQVRNAMARNHDLQAALQAVQAARALIDAAARDALPQGSLAAGAQLQRPSTAEVDPYRQGLPRPPSTRVFSLGTSLAWEIDLFGRVGTAAAVAERRADAAAADAHAAAALLQGEVVRHYTRLRSEQAALALLEAEASLHERRALQLQRRVDSGLADRREAIAAQGEVARVAAERAQAQARLHEHAAALAVLAGRSPLLAATLPAAPLPAPPADSHVVQPADLLARRPDVARAEAQLRAAVGEAVLADRAHLPRLSLNLGFGLNAPFGSLGDSGALRYGVGPALSWDWLDAGRIRARSAAAAAGREAAWHGFEQAVLRALQDGESALRQWTAARQALAEAQRGQALAQQAHEHAARRVAAGLEPPAVALDMAAAEQRARRNAGEAQAAAVLAYAQVQLALGAWQPEGPGLLADGARR